MQDPKPWERYRQQEAVTKPADPTYDLERPRAQADLVGRTITNQGGIIDNRTDLIRQPWIVREEAGKIYDRFHSLPEVKAYTDSLIHINTGLNSPPNAAGDNQLVTAFVKVTDDSMVTGEERRGAQGVAGLTAKLRQQIANVERGEELPPEARQRLRQEIVRVGRDRQRIYDLRRKEFSERAKDYGLNPNEVVGAHPAEAYLGEGQTVENWLTIKQPKEDDGLALGGGSSSFVTADDRRVQRLMQDAYENGASLDQIDRVARENGMHIQPSDYDAYQQLIEYRDNTGRFGQILTPETGQRSGIERGVSAAADSGPGAYAIGAANALTMGGMDELAGVFGGQGAADRVQFAKDYSREASPYWSLAGEVSGTAMNLGGVMGAANKVAPGILQSVPKLVGLESVHGAAHGALEENNNRLFGAGIGAAATVGGDMLGRYAVAPALRGIADTKPVRGALGMFGAKPPVKPDATERLIGDPLNFDSARANLADAERLNLPYSLADADPRLRTVAGSASRKNLGVRQQAEEIMDPRQMGRGDRAKAGIRSDLAEPVDPVAEAQRIEASANRAAQPHYQAFQNETPVPMSNEVRELLETPFGKRAWGRAVEAAENMGIDTTPNNPAMLDLVKKVMDDGIERNPVTGIPTNAGRGEIEMVERFRTAVDGMYPSYSQARQVYADNIRPRSDLEAGQAAFSKRATPEEVAMGMDGASDRFQVGYASAMADKVNNMRVTHNPYDSLVGTPNQQANVRSVFPEGGDDFLRRSVLERDMSATRTELLGGSQTAPRQVADDKFDALAGAGEAALDVGGALAAGVPPTSIFKQRIPDALRFGIGQRGERLAGRVGPTLMDPDPSRALSILDEAGPKVAERLRYNRATGNVGGMFGATLLPPALIWGQ